MPDYVDDSGSKHYHDEDLWKYWIEWLNCFNIPWEQIAKKELAKWITKMEELVADNVQYELPDEWIGMADQDNDIEITLGDLPHENDEDD